MALEPPAFVFTDEESGAELRLDGADLPEPPSDWGGQQRRTRTDYPNGESSIQVHGMQWTPLELNGTWHDGWTQTPGWAQEQKQAARAIMTAGRIVRLDYDQDSVWGTFDVDIKERDRAHVNYEITFEPVWVDPPEYQAVMRFESTPGEDIAAVDDELKQLEAEAQVTDDRIKESWRTELLLRTQRTLNAWGELNADLGGVSTYTDLDAQQAAQVQRQALRTLKHARDLTKRTQGTDPSEMAASGPDRLVAQSVTMRVERRVLLITGLVITVIREVARLRQPQDRRDYRVSEGDTLVSIAEEQLDDWTRWEQIATINGLNFPGQVSPGDVLKMPRP